jgi:hypothetical protein NreA
MSRRLRSSEQQAAIVRRLRSAEGHLRAVIGMVESGQPCEEVLHQLDAVEAALDAAGRALRYCQFRQSIDVIRHSPSAEARLAELERLAVLYSITLENLSRPRRFLGRG